MRESRSLSTKSNLWNLYWVESDGIEDCFVVARNSRSACRVEIDENGFGVGDVRAIKIMRIPLDVEVSCRRNGNRKWPGYVYGRKFFEKLGAEFRTVAGKQEMLLDDIVYAVDDFVPCGILRKRSIGQRAISELRAAPEIANYQYHEEDIWEGPVIHLITALGICLVTRQQIEHYIANSFLLGISKTKATI